MNLNSLHQVVARRLGRPRFADRGDDLVDVVERLLEALEDVGALAGSLQLELGAARDDLLAVLDVLLQRALEREHARLRATLDQRQHVDAEGLLHGGVLEEVVEHLHRLGVALQLDDHAHAGAVRLVAQVADAVDLAVLDQLGDALEQRRLVDLVGQLGDDDLEAIAAVRLLDEGLGADRPRGHGRWRRRRGCPRVPRIMPPVGKSGPVHDLHQLLDRRLPGCRSDR